MGIRYDKIDTSGDCWNWGGKTRLGYGVFRRDNKTLTVHRELYQELHGQIPRWIGIHHKCNNPSCCRPSHLQAVSKREHVLLGDTIPARNAAKMECPKGHPLSGENLVPWKLRVEGCRVCKICKKDHDKTTREKYRATEKYKRKHAEYERRRRFRNADKHSSPME
jgi:hypothetical protein